MPAEADPVVIRDVFPAEVALPGQHLRSARVVVTRARVYAWIGDRELILDAEYDPGESAVPALNAPPSRAAHLRLADGSEVHVNKQRGCGCGSPLKGWQPWSPFRKASA